MKITASERSAGVLTDDRLALAVETLDAIGFLAIEDAIESELVTEMRDETMGEIAAGRAAPNGENTYQATTFPAFEGVWANPQAMGNPILLQVAGAAMRSEFTCSFWNTAIALPGSINQQVHADYASVLDGGERRTQKHMAWALYLTDFTPENGSTEVYPGTQNFAIEKTGEDLEPLANELGIPGVRALGKAGTFILREACLWHRAMSNTTDTPRIMISSMFAPDGSPVQHLDLVRKLEVPQATLDAMSPQAQRVWSINAVV